jgi:hypothetical protein
MLQTKYRVSAIIGRFVEGRLVTESNSTEYYQSREQQERVLAQAANDPAIMAIHLEMAARYSKLVLGDVRATRMD